MEPRTPVRHVRPRGLPRLTARPAAPRGGGARQPPRLRGALSRGAAAAIAAAATAAAAAATTATEAAAEATSAFGSGIRNPCAWLTMKQSSNVPAFLSKLWTLVEETHTNEFITWSQVQSGIRWPRVSPPNRLGWARWLPRLAAAACGLAPSSRGPPALCEPRAGPGRPAALARAAVGEGRPGNGPAGRPGRSEPAPQPRVLHTHPSSSARCGRGGRSRSRGRAGGRAGGGWVSARGSYLRKSPPRRGLLALASGDLL